MRSTGAIGIWLEAGCEDHLVQSPCVPLIRDAVMCVRSGVDLVAYAAHNLVALYDPDAQAVVATLRGHELAVNAVAWLSKCDRYRCTCAGELLLLLVSNAVRDRMHPANCSRKKN